MAVLALRPTAPRQKPYIRYWYDWKLFILSAYCDLAQVALHSTRAPAGLCLLDEPVASFDRVRREAFVELVRSGLIGQRFDQVFISEPEGIFPENPFSHYLRMEAGRITERALG